MMGAMIAGCCAVIGIGYASTKTSKDVRRSHLRASKMSGSMTSSLDYQQRRRQFCPDNTKAPRGREPIHCPALPWLPSQINDVINIAIDQGMRDEASIALMALSEVYDETIYGDVITWPTVPGDCAELKAIELRTRIRVRRLLAELEDIEADEVYPA